MAADELGRVRTAVRRRDQSDAALRDAIVTASRAGKSSRAIGEAAGLTHVRVLQILREEGR